MSISQRHPLMEKAQFITQMASAEFTPIDPLMAASLSESPSPDTPVPTITSGMVRHFEGYDVQAYTPVGCAEFYVSGVENGQPMDSHFLAVVFPLLNGEIHSIQIDLDSGVLSSEFSDSLTTFDPETDPATTQRLMSGLTALAEEVQS